MDNLTILLEKLAEKLGTTTEYLWEVLIRQASVEVLSNLIYLILTILGGIGLLKIHKKLLKEDENGRNLYYKLEEAAIVPMVFGFLLWLVFFFISLLSIEIIINGLFNPEYWALNKVLTLLNN